MDSGKRLTRRPFTTALWIILVAAMTAFLAVAAALWWSSNNLDTVLDDYFTTIAIRKDKGTSMEDTMIINGKSSMYFSQEDVDYLNSLDSVKAVRFHTLTGGIISELQPVVYVPGAYRGGGDLYYLCVEYDTMILDCTVTKIYGYFEHWDYDSDGNRQANGIVSLYAEGVINSRVCGNEDWPFIGYRFGFDEYDDRIVLVFEEVPLAEVEETVAEGNRFLLYGGYTYEKASWNVNNYDWTDQLPRLDVQTWLPFDGDAEGVLAADPAWALLRETYESSQHNFPVMGTDHLESMYLFNQGDAVITQGRSFTKEEYDTGARVMVLSEAVAEKSGLGVGDTVTLSQYLLKYYTSVTDWFYYNHCFDIQDGRLNNPSPGRYDPNTELATQDEAFTIVGLYRLTNLWEDTAFSITPNTVFLPKSAQIPGGFGGVSEPYTITLNQGLTIDWSIDSAWGAYFSLELVNGRIDEFRLAMEESPYAGQFFPYDQGGEEILRSVEEVAGNADKLLLVALLGWALMAALFVTMYQGSQRRNMGTMRSLGAKPGVCWGYLFTSGGLTALLGIALGVAVSGVIMDRVQSWMFEGAVGAEAIGKFSGGMALTEDALRAMMDTCRFGWDGLLLLAAAQGAVLAVVLALHAALTARKPPRKLMGV